MIGVYVGAFQYAESDGYGEYNHSDQPAHMNTMVQRRMANMKSGLANKLSYAFDFKGPSATVDTACSSSLSALTLAINDIKLGN